MAEFRAQVLGDERLQEELLALDPGAFARQASAIAVRAGWSVTPAEIDAAVRDARRGLVDTMGLTPAEVGRWTPIRVHDDGGEPVVDWCHMAGIDFTEPFLDETVQRALRHPFRLLFRHLTPIGGLEALVAGKPGLPIAGNPPARFPVRIDPRQPGARRTA